MASFGSGEPHAAAVLRNRTPSAITLALQTAEHPLPGGRDDGVKGREPRLPAEVPLRPGRIGHEGQGARGACVRRAAGGPDRSGKDAPLSFLSPHRGERVVPSPSPLRGRGWGRGVSSPPPPSRGRGSSGKRAFPSPSPMKGRGQGEGGSYFFSSRVPRPLLGQAQSPGRE